MQDLHDIRNQKIEWKKSAVWLREDFVNFEWIVICSHFCRSGMIKETTSTHFLTVNKNMHIPYMLWFKFIFGWIFFN